MSSPSPAPARPTESPTRGLRLALFALPLVAYAWTATPSSFWLDSSELAGAGITLGVPHPPGHPLWLILAHAASLVPLGPVGWRIALLSAVAGAAAVVLVFDLARELGRAALSGADAPPDAALPATTTWMSAAAALTFALGEGLWLQAHRAEVYTLHLVIFLWLTRAALRWHLAGRPGAHPATSRASHRSLGVLLVAAFVLGLGGGNHHLLLLVHVPPLLVLIAASAEGRRLVARGLPWAAVAGLAGLSLYAVLLLRASTDPLIDYGDPRTLGRLWDVVSAKVFRRSMSEVDTPWGANLAGAGEMYLQGVGPILLLLAPVGLWALARRAPAVAGALLLALIANLWTKVAMVLDPTNPDAFGYFLGGMALVAALSGAAAASLLRTRSMALAAGGCAVALALASAALGAGRRDLSDGRSPAAWERQLEAHVEPGALVLPSFFAAHFQRLLYSAALGARPDVVTVHQGFEDHIEGGRPLAERLRRLDPTLAPVLDAFLAEGRFPEGAPLEAARRRPIYVEPTLSLPLPVQSLRWAGGYLRLDPLGPPPSDGEEAARQRADHGALVAAVGSELLTQREARTTTLLLALPLAVVRLQQARSACARAALDLVESLAPGNPWTRKLAPALAALERAEASGRPEVLAEVRSRLARTDFRTLFGP